MAEVFTSHDASWSEGIEVPLPVLRQLDEEDPHLLEGLREGSESAYEALIERFQQSVYSLVSRLLRDPEEACDVTQEVFLKVFRKVGAFRGDSSLKTWIYRIAVNEAHNHSRWDGRHRRQEVEFERQGDSRGYDEIVPADGASPYDYALDQERHRLLEEALAKLHPGFRSVIVLRDVENLSYEEVAEILRIPLGTVKSRILRGREALRRELEKRLERTPEFWLAPQTVE